MDWRKYEKEIYKYFSSTYSELDITYNAQVLGRYSGINRQIDILIEGYLAGTRIRIVIDGKYYSENVDVKAVESFLGMLNDCEANKGILITQKGYSKAALNRAYYDSIDIELDILNFDEFKRLQSDGAITYKNNSGVLLPAPFGWVVDGNNFPGTLATLYRRGLDRDSAIKENEWMYVQIEEKSELIQSINDLCKLQEQKTLDYKPDAKFTYKSPIKRISEKTLLRLIDIESYPSTEYTGFVEFESFIFCVVMFSTKQTEKRNLRKLEYILESVKPITVIQTEDKTGSS